MYGYAVIILSIFHIFPSFYSKNNAPLNGLAYVILYL